MSDAAEWWPELAPRIAPSRAQRPRGLCVDAHTHLSVPPATALAKPYFRPEFEPRSLYSSPETVRYNAEYRASELNTAQFEDAEQRLADMAAQGVDVQILSVPPTEYFYWLPQDEALRANRMQHQRFAEVIAEWPDRFTGIANVPMAHPELAVEVMREAHGDFGFGGVEISADVLGLDLDDRRFDPVWEAVTELDMTVILHPQGFTHGQRFADYYLVNVMCMPLASTLAVTRMILGGVWHRHPQLRVLVVHGGGYLPFYIARTDHAWRVRPELRHHLTIPPSEVLRSIYVDTNVFDPRMVEQLVGSLGAEHVLMGTDYPFDMSTVDPVGFLAEADLTDEQRDHVLGGNAVRLFGIDAAPAMTTRVAAGELSAFAAAVLRAHGVASEHADTTAVRLVEADVRGRTGHGLIRLPSYVARIRAGGVNIRPAITVRHETPVSAQIDGDNGLGQVVMTRAAELAITKAETAGLAWVGTTHSNHAGAAGLYAHMAADAGLVGIYLAVANANGMPPWGGTNPMLGTNPLAIAIPTSTTPFVLDIASTAASHGTIKVAAQAGRPLPVGWVVDASGRPITDPAQAGEGFLVPMGGYKGSGLTIAIGLLAGVLNGAAFGADVVDHRRDQTTPTNTGQVILALRPDLFGTRERILDDLTRHLDALRDSGTLDGSRVRLPGDEAARMQEANERLGVPISAPLARDLVHLAADTGVASPFPRRSSDETDHVPPA